jgi:hypothetical protein
MDWKLNSLWSIEYENGDFAGKLLSHVSMLPVVAPILAFSIFLANKKSSSLCLFVGLVLCTCLATGLKMVIMSPRPDASHIILPKTSGFPSDHSLSGKLQLGCASSNFFKF